MSLALDGVQNFLPAAAEQLDIDRQFAVHLLDQRQAALKPLPCPLHLEPHHVTEFRRIAGCRNIVFTDAMTAQVLQREIDSSLGMVIAYVLPEIGQLQRGTGEIRKGLPIRIAISAEIENEMAHWIRRIAAVAEQIFEGFVARDRLVLAEGFQQVVERLLGISNFRTVSSSATKTGCRGVAGVAGIEFRLPLVEHFERRIGIAHLVAQIV